MYLKPKYFVFKAKVLCTSFVLKIETDDFYKDAKDDLKEWLDTGKYSKDMVLPEEYAKNAGVNKKVIGKMRNELHKGYMLEFVALSPKVYAYEQVKVDKTLSKEKKARGISKAVTRKTLIFYHYKKCLLNDEMVRCIQHRIKSTPYSVDTIDINKVALKNSDNERLRSFNGITTYPYGTRAFMVFIEELRMKQALASYLETTNHYN